MRGQMPSISSFLDRNFKWLVLLLILVVVAVVAYLFWRTLPPRQFTILTGREGGAYYNSALKYQEIAQKSGFDLQIQTTAGSVEVLEKLRNGEAPIGFVQGGLAVNEDPTQLSSMASVFYEPVWVFLRKDAFPDGLPTRLSQLAGKRVGVGEDGSGTQALALTLLGASGIIPENATFVPLSTADATEQLKSGTVDAAFFVMGLATTAGKALTSDPELELMNFEQAGAYAAQFPYLVPVTIPQGAINLMNDNPPEDKHLVATTANLVVSNDIHPDLLRLMTLAAVQTHEAGDFFAKRYEFPNTLNTDLPVNKKVVAYLERIKSGESTLDNYLPFPIAAIVDRYLLFVVPIALIFLPLLARSTLIYTWFMRNKIRRWYKYLRGVESSIDSMDLAQVREQIGQLQALDEQLGTQLSVSTAYMPELYQLRLHLDYVVEKLQVQEQELLGLEAEQGAGVAAAPAV
jgi:TRAP transporter TAXI family solute receptor